METAAANQFNLTYKGEDFWGRKVYISEAGNYYREVDGVIHSTADPKDFDGEPLAPVTLKEGFSFNFINSPA